jgi:hypothetical protein
MPRCGETGSSRGPCAVPGTYAQGTLAVSLQRRHRHEQQPMTIGTHAYRPKRARKKTQPAAITNRIVTARAWEDETGNMGAVDVDASAGSRCAVDPSRQRVGTRNSGSDKGLHLRAFWGEND